MSEDAIHVSEVFTSIQGEGIHAGIPMVFMRLQGCNIRCNWCDTSYALTADAEPTPVGDVARRLANLLSIVQPPWLCVTGGEPLVQKNTLALLVTHPELQGKASIEVFTNGTIRPPLWCKLIDSWVVDVKCPSTGVEWSEDHYCDWLQVMRVQDTLKFTVQTEDDLAFVGKCLLYLQPYTARPNIVLSPAMSEAWFNDERIFVPSVGSAWLRRVAEYAIERGLRYSLQLHKFVWGDKKGV